MIYNETFENYLWNNTFFLYCGIPLKKHFVQTFTIWASAGDCRKPNRKNFHK